MKSELSLFEQKCFAVSKVQKVNLLLLLTWYNDLKNVLKHATKINNDKTIYTSRYGNLFPFSKSSRDKF